MSEANPERPPNVRCVVCLSEWGGLQLNAPKPGKNCPSCGAREAIEVRVMWECPSCGTVQPAASPSELLEVEGVAHGVES